MEVYLIEQANMVQIDEADMEDEKQLEQRLVRTKAAEIGGVEILYIGQQGTTKGRKTYDLIGVDEDGNLVVVELKQNKPHRKVVAQALDYAARLKDQKYDDLVGEYYEDFQSQYGYDESKSLRDAHRDHFDLDEALSENEFNTEQRIIIIGESIDEDITNIADYLRNVGKIDVILVEYQRFKESEEDIELLTTNAVRRPRAEDDPTHSDKSNSERNKRRKEFWEGFHSKCEQRGLKVSSSASDSASSAVYAFPSGRQDRPAYIQPNLNWTDQGYGLVYNEVRFFGHTRDVIADVDAQNRFEKAIDEAVSTLEDVNLPSDLSERDMIEWHINKTEGEFDKVVISMGLNDHTNLKDDQKAEEFEEWLVDTSLVLQKALKEFKEEGRISTQ